MSMRSSLYVPCEGARTGEREHWMPCSSCGRDVIPPVRVGNFEGDPCGFFSVTQRPRRCFCGAKVRVGYANGKDYEDGVDTFTVKERR